MLRISKTEHMSNEEGLREVGTKSSLYIYTNVTLYLAWHPGLVKGVPYCKKKVIQSLELKYSS